MPRCYAIGGFWSRSVREMRHKGMTVLVASQDPPSVPLKLIELSDLMGKARRVGVERYEGYFTQLFGD